LGIGKVTKMARVGIFAVDEGISYDDPFSLSVCEKMLCDNKDGKWKVSRGFNVLEASGVCPDCSSTLLVRAKHMAIGFKCPKCDSVHLNYKGALDNLRFRKTKTFDITVTDVPAVPWTGVAAFPFLNNLEVVMDKTKLKEKLLEAGIEEKQIDDRLKDLSPEALKEFDDIPMAEVLKEFKSDPEQTEDDVFTLDPAVLKEFEEIVDKRMKSNIDGLEIEIEDSPEFKEYTARLEVIEEKQDEILSMLKELTSGKSKVEKEDQTPRKFRILRHKAAPPEDEEEDDEESDEEDTEDAKPKGKKLPPWLKKSLENKESEDGAVIMDGNGEVHKSMTEFLAGGE
jgi:phage FluMu protein Com